MPEGRHARPYNMTRSLGDLRGRIPRIREAVMCPVTHKPFDKFAVIDLEDIQSQGEIQYYCPHCDTLVLIEFHSPDRQQFRIVDRDHKIEMQ